MRSGTLEQLVTYAGGARIEPGDVLAVLGVADGEQLATAVDAVVARDPAAALRSATALAESGRDPGQVLRDLEAHARELLTVQILGEVPAELRVTPERDARLADQASALSETDAIRLLDLIGAAIEVTADGAQPRIQLELVLIKAAAPQMDPSVAALLARIERLESGARPAAPTSPANGGERANGGSAVSEPSPGAPAASSPAATAPAPTAPSPSAPTPSAPAPSPPAATAPATDAPTVPAIDAPPPSTAPPAPGAPDLAEIVAAWPAVVEIVRGENAMIGALLAGARPVEVTDRELTVAFPEEAAFLKRKAEQDDHRRTATDALRAVTGHSLALRYELRAHTEDADAPADAPQLSGEELVSRIKQDFAAEELLDDED